MNPRCHRSARHFKMLFSSTYQTKYPIVPIPFFVFHCFAALAACTSRRSPTSWPVSAQPFISAFANTAQSGPYSKPWLFRKRMLWAATEYTAHKPNHPGPRIARFEGFSGIYAAHGLIHFPKLRDLFLSPGSKKTGSAAGKAPMAGKRIPAWTLFLFYCFRIDRLRLSGPRGGGRRG